jgi:hypothetical protein
MQVEGRHAARVAEFQVLDPPAIHDKAAPVVSHSENLLRVAQSPDRASYYVP